MVNWSVYLLVLISNFYVGIPFRYELGLIVALVLGILLAWRKKNYTVLILCFFALSGVFVSEYHGYLRRIDNFSSYYGKKVAIEGVICEEPAVSNKGLKTLLLVEKVNNVSLVSSVKVQFFVTKGYFGSGLKYGDAVSGTVTIVPLRPTGAGGVDLAQYYENRNIGGQVYLKDESGSLLIIANRKNYAKQIAINLKNRVIAVLNNNLSQPYNFILEGLLIGNHQKGIPAETVSAFKKTGVVHILVVSGSQIALITGMVIWVCGLIGWGGWPRFMVITVVNVLFLLICGADASIVRAVIMMEIVQLGLVLQRRTSSEHTLLFTAALMITYNPLYARDLGFILSFLSTSALIVLAPRLEDVLAPLPRLLRQPLSVSMAPNLLTFPVIMYFFSTYSVYSIIVNILILPIIELLVCAGFATVMAGMLLGKLLWPVFYSLELFIRLILAVVNFFSADVTSLFSSPLHQLSSLLLVYFLMAIFFVPKKLIKYCLISSIILMTISFLPDYKDSNFLSHGNLLNIYALDVGNGNSALVRTPDGHNILIDAGGPGSSCIVPFLRRQRINKLDAVIITHAHKDHYEAMQEIEDNFPVEQVLVSCYDSSNYLDLISKQDKLVRIGRGTEILIGDVRLKVYYPGILSRSQVMPEDQLNACSLVFSLSYNDFCALFTGDATSDTLEQVMHDIVLPQADIVMIPHHGAKNAGLRKLIEEIQPQDAIISVGPNKYGHPNKSTLALLDYEKVRVHRTDKENNIWIISDGTNIMSFVSRICGP